MKMADLVSYGYPAGLIKIWEKEESPDLLPLQEEAITKYDLLAKALRNLLVIAPTSSGKTFIGELAAVKQALEMRRALFLVPYRAIAEEQFANFQSKYKDYGLRIAISDRDHREYDDDIIAGEYEIAIIVYEKFVGLMVQNPELVNGCGVVIVDEVQMMMDRERGPTIELLLTKLLLLQPPVRLIALSAVLDKLNGFDEWLKAAVLRSELRPVELREGVYTPEGNVRYREFNSKQRGTEQLNPWDGRQGALVNLVQSSINRGEQALIFCSTRESTVKTAKALSKELRDAPPALSTIKSANDLPDTSTREELQDLLQAGVAYHNSDLTLDERLLVEEGFRRNDINVITCTSTLAMGVNIPARNAIIYEPYKWSGSARRFIPIAVSEYKNMTGRAGRYSFGDLFGLSYLIAESEAERDKFDMNFITGAFEGFSSKFGERPIDSQVLDIIAGGLAATESDVQSFIFATYNGKHSWTTDKTKSTIKGMISDSISRCLKCEALTLDKSGSINVTDSGRLCAAGGFSLSHLERASDYFNNYEKDVDLSIIYWALDTDVAAGTMAYHIGRLRTPEFTCFKYQNALAKLSSEENVGPLLDVLASNPYVITYEQCVVLRRCLACYAWISPASTRQIEANFPGITIGAVRNTAEVCAWLVSLLRDLVKITYPGSNRYIFFERLIERLSYGATSESLGLCIVRGSGLSRDERNHLVKVGIKTIDDILARKKDEIPLSRNRVLRLIKAAEATIEDSVERRKRFQQTRLGSLGLDTSLLKNLYEKTGRQLEFAIDDLLQRPFTEITCRRVTKQNEGEPDHLLYDSSSNVFAIQTTAREKKNVNMKKATSIIGQSSKYKPYGYIVIGRPDFESLAIKDAENQVASGRNYKLIPIPALAETYVLFKEGKISSDDVDKILIEWKGYISLTRLYDYIRDRKQE